LIGDLVASQTLGCATIAKKGLLSKREFMRKIFELWLVGFFLVVQAAMSWGQEQGGADITIGPGDLIRIVVFQNPDLSLETRVSESGAITYPLLGTVQVGGLTVESAEKRIANGLREGGFVPQPQVNISQTQVLGNRVSVLGLVGKPGRIPLENFSTRVTEILATAGGIAQGGDDTIILIGKRGGKPYRKEIDLPAIYLEGNSESDVFVAGGDIIYVHRAPIFYVYGEVQRPGSFRVERGMTVQQALVQAGGPSPRGTEDVVQLHRRDKEGRVVKFVPELFDPIKPNDVLFARERLF
jgi:polysaccharide export outer membrane protein